MTAPPPELARAASGSLGTYTFVDEEELLGAPPPTAPACCDGASARQAHLATPLAYATLLAHPLLQASRSGWRSWSCWWVEPGQGLVARQQLQWSTLADPWFQLGRAVLHPGHVRQCCILLHPCCPCPILQVGNARGRAKPDPVQCFQLLQASMGCSVLLAKLRHDACHSIRCLMANACCQSILY